MAIYEIMEEAIREKLAEKKGVPYNQLTAKEKENINKKAEKLLKDELGRSM